jgi:hypothetical protein
MRANTKYLIPIILAGLLAALVGASHAQEQAPISAEVDRTSLSTGEMLTLRVTIRGSMLDAPRPALPAFEGFDVVNSSTSSQTSIVNGDISSQMVYTYHLRPYQTGDLVIEPIQMTMDGQVFSTEPIVVQAVQGGQRAGAPTTAPQMSAGPLSEPLAGQAAALAAGLAGQELYVEAEVDNPTPYVGQQVVYTLRLYQAASSWHEPRYEPPSFTGFWAEEDTEQPEYQVQAAGRIYRVTEVRTILFPSVVGPVTIEPARLTTSGGLFRPGKRLHTQPVTVEVQPLPPDAPVGFDGAVGHFTLTGSVDPTGAEVGFPRPEVNEPVTWRVTLSGRGNFNAAPDPFWSEIPGWRAFESKASVHTQVQDGQMVGIREYERLLVPGEAGEFTIPPLSYVYFDPGAGAYRTTTTEPISVSVVPSPAGPQTTGSAAMATGSETQTERLGAADMEPSVTARPLKPVPARLALAPEPVSRSGLYWVAWGFPLAGAAGYLLWQRRQRYLEDNLGLARSARARKRAKEALAQARRQQGDAGQDAYVAAQEILTTYLADKLSRPVTGLTRKDLTGLLAERGLDPNLVDRVSAVLISSELSRFAPGADSPAHAASLLKEVEILVGALERALSRPARRL